MPPHNGLTKGPFLYEVKWNSPVYTPSQSRASAKKGSSDRGVSEYSERQKDRLFEVDKDLRSCDRRRACKRVRDPERWSRPGGRGCKGSVSCLEQKDLERAKGSSSKCHGRAQGSYR